MANRNRKERVSTGKGSRVEWAGACLKEEILHNIYIDRDGICGKIAVAGWGTCRRLRNSFHTYLPHWYVAPRQSLPATDPADKPTIDTQLSYEFPVASAACSEVS